MKKTEFQAFVSRDGKDILRFCRVITGSEEQGDELYQDTMVKLLEKVKQLEINNNPKSYALSVAVFLWKNKKKKMVRHERLVPSESMSILEQQGVDIKDCDRQKQPEEAVLRMAEVRAIQKIVAELPEKYRILLYLYYSGDMKIVEIADILKLPEGTVKTRLYKAKKIIKEEWKVMGYDG